ncbi:MAG TPA: cytochrome c maturation protein CcmE [Tepidisphaeraceae bacterium]|nr:cytochrome c maturation protein CcmE [Tepidisphaeraceae bacterium]
MPALQKKLLLGGALLVVAVGYLAYAGMKSGWVYYMEVDHFLADDQFKTQRVRLHGKVSEQDFNVKGLDANFSMLGKSRSINVAYHGVIPDMFQSGRDVVVEGQLDQAGVFRAQVLMTKCASKYEPNSPHQNIKEQS